MFSDETYWFTGDIYSQIIIENYGVTVEGSGYVLHGMNEGGIFFGYHRLYHIKYGHNFFGRHTYGCCIISHISDCFKEEKGKFLAKVTVKIRV